MSYKGMNLQRFAGENTNLNVRSFSLQFKEMLQAVFTKQAYFDDFFAGGLEALDGVRENQKAFTIKTTNMPVVMGEGYSTDANKVFGTGASGSNRFGELKEVKYADIDVEYTWGWNFREGLDRYTVNNDLDAAVADRTELQAQAKVSLFNKKHSAFISKSAGKTIAGGTITKDNVADIFNQLSAYFVNIEAVGTKVAKVTPAVYNAIIDSTLTTTAKGSGVQIDENGIARFKGFTIQEVPESMFQSGEAIYAYIAGVGKAFTGIVTTRTIEATNFDGVEFQGAGKAGEFILEDNKKAVVKVTAVGA